MLPKYFNITLGWSLTDFIFIHRIWKMEAKMEMERVRKKWHEHPRSLGESSDIIWEIGKIPILNKDKSPTKLLPKWKKWNTNITNETFWGEKADSSLLLSLKNEILHHLLPSYFISLWIFPWSPPYISLNFQIGSLPVSHFLSLNDSIFTTSFCSLCGTLC